MDKNIENKLREYCQKSRGKCFALRDWINLKMKQFTLLQALECIFNAADGNFQKMDDIISRLSNKKKVYGRTQVYANEEHNSIDIRKNENGELELVGYNTSVPLNLKGQKGNENSRIFRKSDNQTSKTYQNAEEKMYNLGSEVRKLFPNESNVFLTQAMKAIRDYAISHKINPIKVVSLINKNRLVLDDDNFIVKPLRNENVNRKIIVINEDIFNNINDKFEITEYKFFTSIKQFLHDLLVDPVNAKVPIILSNYNYSRSRLIGLLKSNDLLRKSERIVDKDENGNDKIATMQVKYKVPKKNFDRKLRNLYIKLFERNVPEKMADINEDGECCADGITNAESSGQYVQSLSSQKKDNDIDETTSTSSVGNYQYDVPLFGDKESLIRKNGLYGSTSVNKM